MGTAVGDTVSGIRVGAASMWLFLLLQGSRSSLDTASCRSMDSARPVGQVDRHIQLMVHGVAPAGRVLQCLVADVLIQAENWSSSPCPLCLKSRASPS